jgi:hypothetical protein
MNPDKVIQLSYELMDMTSSGEISWTLINKKPLLEDEPDSGIDVVKVPSPLALVSRVSRVYSDVMLRSMYEDRTLEEPWERFLYSSSPIDGKTFRMNGEVYDSGEYRKVRLQLWNADESEMECEFPESSSFINLFQLVHNRAINKASEFVDTLLEKRKRRAESELLAAAH